MTTKLEQAIALIDTANAADPKTETHEGESYPKEQIYGIRMMAWVERLDGDASDALKIAARAQHIRRWEIARDGYPEGKAGYYAWRTFLYGFHGEKAGEIMRGVGYDEGVLSRRADQKLRSLSACRRLRPPQARYSSRTLNIAPPNEPSPPESF